MAKSKSRLPAPGGDEITMRYEIPGVYDGWSCAQTRSGRWINRWDTDDPRWRPTQDYIERMRSLRPRGGKDQP